MFLLRTNVKFNYYTYIKVVEKEFSKVSPDVKMYLEHGKAFPGFDQSRKIRGGLKGGGLSQRGLGKAFK